MNGEFLFATVSIQGTDVSTDHILVPLGWTEIRHDVCGLDLQVSIAFRIASGDVDNQPYVWSFTDVNNTPTVVAGSGGVALYSGVINANPIIAGDTTFQCTTGSATISAPGFNTTVPNELDMFVGNIFGNNDSSGVVGYSQVYEQNNSGTGPDIRNDFKVAGTSGTVTGTATSTAATAGDNIGYQIGVQPGP